MSLCYINMQSHTYVILNVYMYTLTYAPKISVVQYNKCDFSRTYSFGLGEYVWAYLYHGHPTLALTRKLMGGGVSICVRLILWEVCLTVYDNSHVSR